MNNIIIGKQENIKYDFRETCFGIVVKNDKLLVVKKDEQYSLIGGGLENGENFYDCIKREFLEESGYTITKVNDLATIDCFWLAGGKWPLESLANIFVVEIDYNTKVEPLEKNHTIEYIELENAIDLLPLPYHKKAIEIFLSNKN